MKQKIAFVTPLYLPAPLSGSGVVVRELAESLTQKGYDCTVVTSDGLNARWWYDPIFGQEIKNKFEIINGVKVYRLNCKQLLSFICLVLVRHFKLLIPKPLFNKLQLLYSGPNLTGLANLLKKEKFDIIYSSPFPVYLNKQVADAIEKLTPRPEFILMPCFHSLLPDYHNPELKKVLEKADLIHVFSNVEKDDIKRIFQIPDRRFAVIPLFLNFSKMSDINQIKDKIANFKKKFKLKNKKIILFAGSKIRQKGVFTLVNTFKNLYKNDPSYVLITLGNATPEWNKCKKKRDLDFLLDLGYVEEKQKEIVFGACNIFCMPSLAESFGLTYLEAWHKKKPVIGANIPSVKELIDNARGGLLVRFGDEKDLERAIKRLVFDSSLAKKLGENGYRALVSNYDFLKVFSKNLKNILK